jgi:deoxyuridine 5'-triphosphate nucleotidohydrolase
MGATLSHSIVWRNRAVEVTAEEAGCGVEAGAEPLTEDDELLFRIPCESPCGVDAPARASAHAAGFDLRACEEVTIPAACGGAFHPVNTGVVLALTAPTNAVCNTEHFTLFGHIHSRSGLAKKGVTAFPGVIDADYRGEIVVLLTNCAPEPFVVRKNERIAQLVFQPAYTPRLVPCARVAETFSTVRGASGFGSTGGTGPVVQPIEGA